MPVLSDAHHFRKMVAGVCMVLAPLFLLVGAIVHPGFKTDEAELLASAAGSLDAWYLAEMLFLISIVLAVPATLGLMHMLRERHVAAGHGGGLALIGLLAYTGVTAIQLVDWQMAQPQLERGQMIPAARRQRRDRDLHPVLPVHVRLRARDCRARLGAWPPRVRSAP
jgi:hypothetical protein